MMLLLALAALVGVTLGLLGGGGSILTVPILVYVAHLPAKDGIATSLLVVGVTSAVAMFSHARRGRVAWRVGALFGATSMAGAYAGGRVAYVLPSSVLLAGFTLMMAITALAMMRPRNEPAAASVAPHGSVLRAVLTGVAIGLLTGVVGAGGGFVIVPALVLLSNLPMRTAVGTSLLVITMNSIAGFVGALPHATIPWSLAAQVTTAAVLGSLLGVISASRIEPALLRKGFAWFVLAMASFMTVKQIQPSSAASTEISP